MASWLLKSPHWVEWARSFFFTGNATIYSPPPTPPSSPRTEMTRHFWRSQRTVLEGAEKKEFRKCGIKWIPHFQILLFLHLIFAIALSLYFKLWHNLCKKLHLCKYFASALLCLLWPLNWLERTCHPCVFTIKETTNYWNKPHLM